MRYPASAKLEIIRLVGQSRLPIQRALEQIGIPRAKFYRWYDLYRRFGEPGLEDRSSGPYRPRSKKTGFATSVVVSQFEICRPQGS